MIPASMEDAVLLDSNIAIFALGADGPVKERCRAYLSALTSGKNRGYASTEMVQEVVFHRLRRTGNRRLAASEGRALVATLTILKFDYEVLATSLQLIEEVPGIRGRDAIHAATALEYGIPTIASTDSRFVVPQGLTRFDPTTDEASAAASANDTRETP